MPKCLTCKTGKLPGAFFHTEIVDSEKSIQKPVYWGLHCIECHDAGLVPYGWGWGNFPKRPPWYEPRES